MAQLPTNYTDSVTPTGATTELPATTTRGINAINTEINRIAARTVGPVRLRTGGGETYTIVGGTVTQIAGTTVTGVSLNVGDRILICSANLTSGAGSFQTSVPANGIYRVTNNTTNLTVVRDDDMSVTNPAGLEIGITGGDFTGWAFAIGEPTNPFSTFTYGTDNIGVGASRAPGLAQDTGLTYTNKIIDGAGNTLTIRAADIPSGITNGNTALQSQVVVSATDYYITNSNLNLPATMKVGLVVGSRFRWTVAMAKTAAGTGAFAIKIYRGTNGTTADTADVNQTIGTQTAVVDSMMVDVEVVITTTGATGAYFWSIIPMQRATTATGFGVATGATGQFSGTVSSVNLTTASLKFGLVFRATTGTPTITIPMVRAQALNVM